MAYPVQPYEEHINESPRGDLMQSFFGMANRMMSDAFRADGIGGFSSLMMSDGDPTNSDVKVFGVSSMNVTQISRGPDGRPRIVQAHDERRMGPGGVWQTKKALRDTDRGIDRMQVGYFVGDQGEVIERQLDPKTGQYRKEIKRRGVPQNQLKFSDQWRSDAQRAMQPPQRAIRPQQHALPPQTQRNQQIFHSQEQTNQQALPSSSYQYY